MIEKIIEIYNSEPIAVSIGLMIMGYIILRITGLWEWLPDRVYNLKETKSQTIS